MLNFKNVILFAFIILISVLSCVSAQDSADYGNFTQLNDIVENSDDFVNLSEDYAFAANDSDLNINRGMEIHGNNHELDFNGSSMIIGSDESIVFENISFKSFNRLNVSYGIDSINLTFNHCNFDYNEVCYANLTVETPDFNLTDTGTISPYIKNLAKKIVGKSTGIDACKKLAKWVGSHIVHETKAGFYQSPLDTLFRKRGNCCSQTNLFLQMCDAVGALEGHKAYFIHVGTMEFGERHFFCMIDDVVIDVDSRPNSPWGKAGFNGRDVYGMTPYPYLPLPRQY